MKFNIAFASALISVLSAAPVDNESVKLSRRLFGLGGIAAVDNGGHRTLSPETDTFKYNYNAGFGNWKGPQYVPVPYGIAPGPYPGPYPSPYPYPGPYGIIGQGQGGVPIPGPGPGQGQGGLTFPPFNQGQGQGQGQSGAPSPPPNQGQAGVQIPGVGQVGVQIPGQGQGQAGVQIPGVGQVGAQIPGQGQVQGDFQFPTFQQRSNVEENKEDAKSE